MLPPFEVVTRLRPVRLVVPDSELPGAVAPYVAVEAVRATAGRAELALRSGDVVLAATYDEGVSLHVTAGGRTSHHRSRRWGRPDAPVEEVALALTGPQVTAFTREGGAWVARGRVDLLERVDVHDEPWLASLTATSTGPLTDVRSGTFGQLGLRDVRVVSNADGTPHRQDGRVLLTASSSGPGFFPTSHASVWSLEVGTLELEHRGDLFLRRADRPGVYGDHAVHLVRDRDRWLLAASTWGDFDRTRPGHGVAVTLAESAADLLSGTHVLDTRPLPLPVTGFRSVGVWDPHLVRADEGWLVGYVSASRWFRFHPVVATGPDLDTLTLRAAATDRRATEGTTLVRLDGVWRVVASDGRDGRRGQQAAYPVFDLDLRELGHLDAAYPTNLPWPTLVPPDQPGDDWLMIGFDGSPYGGALVGYGSHGDVIVQRSSGRRPNA